MDCDNQGEKGGFRANSGELGPARSGHCCLGFQSHASALITSTDTHPCLTEGAPSVRVSQTVDPGQGILKQHPMTTKLHTSIIDGWQLVGAVRSRIVGDSPTVPVHVMSHNSQTVALGQRTATLLWACGALTTGEKRPLVRVKKWRLSSP